jgi:hypothetical protein
MERMAVAVSPLAAVTPSLHERIGQKLNPTDRGFVGPVKVSVVER